MKLGGRNEIAYLRNERMNWNNCDQHLKTMRLNEHPIVLCVVMILTKKYFDVQGRTSNSNSIDNLKNATLD